MSINYTWTVTNLETLSSIGEFNDVITTVVSQCRAETTRDGEAWKYEELFFTSLNTSNLDSSTFTEYSSLTEADILSWVFSIENKSEIEAFVGGAVSGDSTFTAPSEKALPWS